ncbi:Predicted membrane protein [Chromobacterium violaceum]|uniref:Predicted membrane protein n=1 Tax=Chromobacterium violaceum TaxID=536 RepID=A0A447TAB3_CHRVL|nr:Predicted membrane protein [Chromobacterium violaceum]
MAGAYPWDGLLGEALPYYFLLSWSEAFTTGLLLAVLTVYKPRWVSTFDDGRYLGGKPGRVERRRRARPCGMAMVSSV